MSRKPKKIDFIDVRTAARVHRIDVRFDRESGEFSAEIGDETFRDNDFDGLKKQLQSACDALDSTTFERYIVVEYRNQDHWGSGRDHGGVRLELSFYCVELSPLIDGSVDTYSGKPRRVRLEREVDELEDGTLEVSDDPPSRQSYTGGAIIPFTEKRWATLCAVRAELRRVDKMLSEVLTSDEDKFDEMKRGAKVAAALDSAHLGLLLGPASSETATEPEPRKKRRA